MKRHSLIHGILIALLLSAAAFVMKIVLGFFLPWYLAPKLIAAIISLLYISLLVGQAGTRVGKLTLECVAIAIIGFELLLGCSSIQIAMSGLALAWIVRSLLYHRRPVAAVLDGVLSIFAFAVAAFVIGIGGGVVAAIWSLFLIQALYVLVPAKGIGALKSTSDETADPFVAAYRTADNAIGAIIAGR